MQLRIPRQLRQRVFFRFRAAKQDHGVSQTHLMVSMIDQVVLSVFNFVLNIALIRLLSPAALGNYAVIISLGLIWSSVQGALIGIQLSVLRPQLSEQGNEGQLLTTLWTANCVLVIFSVFVSAFAIAIFERPESGSIALTAGLYVGGSLLREYVRSLLFSERRPAAVLASDLLYVGIATMLLIGIALNIVVDFGVVEVLAALTCANIGAGLAVIASRTQDFNFRLDQQTLNTWGQIWRGPARWALFGAITHEIASRSHVFVVGAVFGAASVGRLQAGETLFRPLSLVGQAWERVARPRFAHLAMQKDDNAVRSLERVGLATVLLISIWFFGILYFGWPVLTHLLFAGTYVDMNRVVLFWAAATLAQLISQIYATKLQGFARFRELGAIGFLSALVGALLLILVVQIAPVEWTIAALIGANLTGIVCMKMSRRENDHSGSLARSVHQAKRGAVWERTGHDAEESISVCICTYQRPAQLLRTLQSIARQRLTKVSVLEIVIVDNDAAASAQSIVEEFSALSVHPVRYVIEPIKGLSAARNRLVQEAKGHWLACIDDDEEANEDWIEKLFECAKLYHADAVIGAVIPRFEMTPPSWILQSRAFSLWLPPTGCRVGAGDALTGNALLNADFMNANSLIFSAVFDQTGGEDTDFFCKLIKCGGNVVSAREAIVHENVPDQRLTTKYLTKRAVRQGEIHAIVTCRHGDGLTKVLDIGKASINIVAAALATMACLPFGRTSYHRSYLLLVRNIGRVRYYAGFSTMVMYP